MKVSTSLIVKGKLMKTKLTSEWQRLNRFREKGKKLKNNKSMGE